MITHEMFVKKVEKEYSEFHAKELKKNPLYIFNDYYDIYAMSEIRSYLVNTDIVSELYEKLYNVNDLLTTLREFEMDYDEPMFTTWDNIEKMIDDFVEERL